MELRLKITAWTLLTLQFSGILFAQQKDYPEVGKPCPDFKLMDITHYHDRTASLHDFKGKWLVLDFWNRGCMGCVESFPKMNSLYKECRDKMELISVGYTGSQYYKSSDDKIIRNLYSKLQQRLNLEIPEAFDSTMFHQFGIEGCPYIVIVNPNGIVKAITISVTAQDMKELISGNTPELEPALNKWQSEDRDDLFDFKKPLLVDNNGGSDSDFLFRSLLTKFHQPIPFLNTYYFVPSPKNNEVRLAGLTVSNLYQIAYGDTVIPFPQSQTSCYGEWWLKPILEVADTSVFYRGRGEEGLYCYDLIVPPAMANRLYMKEMMKQDLKNYFGYDVKVEKRIMPYWRLIATPDAEKILKTKGGKPIWEGDGLTKLGFTNQPVSNLIKALWARHQSEPPFIDETSITTNLDLTLAGFLKDVPDLKILLQKNGLDLVEGRKEMNVIVIRDSRENASKAPGIKRGF
jgi:peroxiredoxin